IENRAQHVNLGDSELEDALHTLLMVCYCGGRAELWQPFDRALALLGPNIPAALYPSSRTLADPVRAPATVLEELAGEIDGLADELDLARVVRVAMRGNIVDRIPDCREALCRTVRARREDGAVPSGIFALVMLGSDDY